MRRVAKRERGYNLVEVLLAMALLGTVLISIMALFFFGQRNVYSGKQMTNAVALATHVLEDINTLNKTQMLAAFNLSAAATGTGPTLYGKTYPANSFTRTTTNIDPATTDPKGFLQRWKDEMVNNNKFQDGVITVLMTPKTDKDNPSSPQLNTADMMQVRVFVAWKEAARQRVVTVDSLKIDRQ